MQEKAMRSFVCLIIAAVAFVLTTPALAAEKVVDLPVRGSIQRVLVDVPANAVGSVVLLAGGAGVLDISATGNVTRLFGNQLVRTRALYVRAGFATAVPDIATDLKDTQNYRGNGATHGRDIAAVIAHMRTIKGPVALVATSRGALSAATVMLRQSDALPDALVITSGALRGPNSSAEAIGNPANIKVPVLLIAHRDDTCRVTLPADMAGYGARLTGSRKVEIITLSGGTRSQDDPCEAYGPHGFAGIDQLVVDTITAWLKANMR
jgi:pimeloyl-ACP methyl ester carboxylesterase